MNLRRLMEGHIDVSLINQLATDKAFHLVVNHDYLQRGIEYEIDLYMKGTLTGWEYHREEGREHGPPFSMVDFENVQSHYDHVLR